MLTQFDNMACDNLHVRLWSQVAWALLRVILLNSETVLPAVERDAHAEFWKIYLIVKIVKLGHRQQTDRQNEECCFQIMSSL